MREADFQSSDGLRIHYRVAPATGAPKAVVVINHGVNSHSGRYLWTLEQFAQAGFAAYAIDMRGRGKSEGKRLSIKHVSEHTGDLHQLIGIAKSENPGLPLFLLGHSAGGVVSCTYALDHQAELTGFICESFAYKVPAPGPVLWLVENVIGPLLPGVPVLKNDLKFFSRDPAAVAALKADPLVNDEAQPAGTVAALLRATDRMRQEFPTVTLPVLIMHGTSDKITMHRGSEEFFARAGSKDKQLKLYEGHYHDLLDDYGKEEVFAEIRSWIEARLP